MSHWLKFIVFRCLLLYVLSDVRVTLLFHHTMADHYSTAIMRMNGVWPFAVLSGDLVPAAQSDQQLAVSCFLPSYSDPTGNRPQHLLRFEVALSTKSLDFVNHFTKNPGKTLKYFSISPPVEPSPLNAVTGILPGNHIFSYKVLRISCGQTKWPHSFISTHLFPALQVGFSIAAEIHHPMQTMGDENHES